MSVTFEGVVRNGVVEPKTPMQLPEGKEARVTLLDQPVDDGLADEMSAEEERFWAEWGSEPSPVPAEEWEQFDQFIRQNRFTFRDPA